MTEISWEKNTKPNEDESKCGITGESAVYKEVVLGVYFYHNDYEGEPPKMKWYVQSHIGFCATLQANGEVVVYGLDESPSREELQTALSLAKKRAEAVAVCFAECKVE